MQYAMLSTFSFGKFRKSVCYSGLAHGNPDDKTRWGFFWIADFLGMTLWAATNLVVAIFLVKSGELILRRERAKKEGR